MMLASTFFAFCGIITEQEALSGFGNSGVIALAVLFVLSRAIEMSGLFDGVVHQVLGRSGSTAVAQIRLMLPVSFMSAVMNNTPLIAMMLPVVSSWAKQGGLDTMKFMMPLAYAGSIGGTLSKIGSPTNLVAANYKFDPRLSFSMGFFETIYGGVALVLATVLYVVIFSPFLLRASVQPESREVEEVSKDQLYKLPFLVKDDSEMVGRSWKTRGLHRLPRTQLIYGPCGGAASSMIAPPSVENKDEDVSMRPGDQVVVIADAEGIATIRRVYGLVIDGNAGHELQRLWNLGVKRMRQRRLFEVLPAGQTSVDWGQLRDWLLQKHHAALISCRGSWNPKQVEGSRGFGILLIEAEESFEAACSTDFALVRKVPNSAPLRSGRRADPLRAWSSLFLVATVVVLSALGIQINGRALFPLASLCVWATSALIGLDIITNDEALGSVNVRAFLAIASAFGLGKGMANSGTANAIAEGLVNVAKSSGLGNIGIAGGLMLSTSILSNLISNTATVVLMIPIAERVALQEGVPIKVCVFLILYGANCAFSTPFATAPNLLVQAPLGPSQASYSFADFLRFGIPLQILNIVVGVAATLHFYGE